jgi:iron complex transport system substrate-binding protein
MTRMTFARRVLGGLSALALAGTLVACSGDDSSGDGAAGGNGDGQWPRSVPSLSVENSHTVCDNANDIDTCKTEDIEIPDRPQRIVSTAVGLTGSLLAVDAPVVASGGATTGPSADNAEGFFNQWADEAHDKGVEGLWNLAPDLEKIVNADPDLILVAANGQDSAVPGVQKIRDIGVPVIVVDYVAMDWKELTTLMGRISGHEADAQARIDEYDDHVARVKEAITRPEQPVNLMLPSADMSGNANYWTEESPQGRVATDLGWTLSVPGKGVARDDGPFADRPDVRQVTAENQDRAMVGHTVLAANAGNDDDPADFLKGLPTLQGAYAVQKDRIFSLPAEVFRLDFYSANMMLDRIQELFAA